MCEVGPHHPARAVRIHQWQKPICTSNDILDLTGVLSCACISQNGRLLLSISMRHVKVHRTSFCDDIQLQVCQPRRCRKQGWPHRDGLSHSGRWLQRRTLWPFGLAAAQAGCLQSPSLGTQGPPLAFRCCLHMQTQRWRSMPRVLERSCERNDDWIVAISNAAEIPFPATSPIAIAT